MYPPNILNEGEAKFCYAITMLNCILFYKYSFYFELEQGGLY